MVDLKTGVPIWNSVFAEETFIFQHILSATGDEITFIKGASGASDVYRLNVFTGEISRLTPTSAQRGSLALSPDEGMIAYNEGSAVYVMNSDGTDVREISDSTIPDIRQARILGWTHDGDYVVIQAAIDETSFVNDVYALAVDGSAIMRLTDSQSTEQSYNNWYACFPQER